MIKTERDILKGKQIRESNIPLNKSFVEAANVYHSTLEKLRKAFHLQDNREIPCPVYLYLQSLASNSITPPYDVYLLGDLIENYPHIPIPYTRNLGNATVALPMDEILEDLNQKILDEHAKGRNPKEVGKVYQKLGRKALENSSYISSDAFSQGILNYILSVYTDKTLGENGRPLGLPCSESKLFCETVVPNIICGRYLKNVAIGREPFIAVNINNQPSKPL